MTRKEDIIKTALSWKGTPYKHQHSKKGYGCDCLGFLLGVYREHYGKENCDIPNYSRGWDEVSRNEDMLREASKHLIKTDKDDLNLANVIVFRMKREAVAKHCGIVVEPNLMLHSYQGSGKGSGVTPARLVPYWKNKIAGVFRFPGVM